ncbi:MAG: hypothetical protein IKN55_06940 [Oscillospiraceae bacterium]|nr:hypothetical protein [Oscillospiraceae bacterium]
MSDHKQSHFADNVLGFLLSDLPVNKKLSSVSHYLNPFTLVSVLGIVVLVIVNVLILMNTEEDRRNQSGKEFYQVVAELTDSRKTTWTEQVERHDNVVRGDGVMDRHVTEQRTVEGYLLTYSFAVNGKEGRILERTTLSPESLSKTKQYTVYEDDSGVFREVHDTTDTVSTLISVDCLVGLIVSPFLVIGLLLGHAWAKEDKKQNTVQEQADPT